MFVLQYTEYQYLFSRPFKTEEELDLHISQRFHDWKGIKSRDNELTLEDYMVDKQKVILTIKKI
jgi:hypothetical protein